jgi:hypothetical protein
LQVLNKFEELNHLREEVFRNERVMRPRLMILLKLGEKWHRKLIACLGIVNRLVVHGTHHQEVRVVISVLF